MKILLNFFSLLLLLLATVAPYEALAEIPEAPIMTEASDPNENRPLDDIVEKRLTFAKRVLPYDHVREADIFWEKRIWRVIDIREKMNLPFAYPERPFFSILMDAASAG